MPALVIVVGSVVAATGLALAWWALWRDRSRGRRRCPRCWYDLGGGAGRRCPECGHEARDEAALRRTRRRWLPGLAGLLLALAPAAWLGGRFAVERGWQYALLPTWRTIDRIDLNGLATARLEEIRNPRAPAFRRRIVVTRDGDDVLVLEGFYLLAGGATTQRGANGPVRIGLGEDVTGDGVPDLVLQSDTGGSGGGMTTYLYRFETGPGMNGVTPVAVLPWSGLFEPPADGEPLRFVCGDPSFAYKWTSGAASPRPTVTLAYRAWPVEGFVLDVDATRREAPDDATLARMIDAGGADPAARFATVLRTALDLIYGGHHELGLALLERERATIDAAVPAGYDAFRAEFDAALASSPFAAWGAGVVSR